RGERVVRAHDLRRADGDRRGGGGRCARLQSHRGGDRRRSARVALRRVPPAASRVRARSAGDRRRPEDRAALGVAGSAARRFRDNGVGSRFSISTADTSTGAILGADSARLQVWITRHDTATHNLRLALYRLPITIDSTTTFTDLAGSFTDSLLKQVNIDTLLTLPGRKDSVTGDSIDVRSLNRRPVLWPKLIAPAARYLGTDSGTVSYGIRIAADTLPNLAPGKGLAGPFLQG